jgi:hypothetical protein
VAVKALSPLPRWMRGALYATAVMNLLGFLLFTPYGAPVRSFAGMPAGAHPIYLLTIGLFILIFGLAYLWTAFNGTTDPLFIAMAAAGKLGFFGLLLGYWLAGELSFRAPLSAIGDLVFAGLFTAWLIGAPTATSMRR